MAWIVQLYEGDAHVVPDTEPGHVLELECFCAPRIEQLETGCVVTHRDEAQRIFQAPATGAPG